MTDKRMSEDAAAMALKLRTHCFAGGRLCADRVVRKCRNCTAADMIDALRAELTAARTVADGEVAEFVQWLLLEAAQPGRDAGTSWRFNKTADLLRRLSAARAEAERERDSARADALEEAARVFDAIPDETEISPEHWQEDPDTGFRVKVGRTTKRAALRPSFIAARIRALIAQGEQ